MWSTTRTVDAVGNSKHERTTKKYISASRCYEFIYLKICLHISEQQVIIAPTLFYLKSGWLCLDIPGGYKEHTVMMLSVSSETLRL